MEPIRIFSDSDSKLPLLLLYEDLPRFVVPGLPNADDSAVRLDLVNVCAWNPNLLRRIDRSRNYCRRDNRRRDNGSRDNRSRDDAWADDCVGQDATDNSADEARPKAASAMSPPAMMVMVHWRRPGAMMHHRRRPPSKATRMAKAATRTAKARASHKRSCRQNRAKCKYKFLVHVCLSFLRFCGHVKIGHEADKN